MNKRQACGFTLVEILVVLVITGFIVTILMQALHQVFRLQTHFGHEIFHTQQGAMYADWYRQSINSLMPDSDDGKYKFRGEPRHMSGLTLSPLDQEGGVLAPFAWRLEFDPQSGQTVLHYGEAEPGKPSLPVLSWPGNSGHFIYLDAENGTHDNWPPFLGKWPQLPSAIYLESGTQERLRLIVATPWSAGILPLRRKDIEAL